MYHVSLAAQCIFIYLLRSITRLAVHAVPYRHGVQCIYGCRDEGGEDGNGKEGSDIPGGWERVEIAWPLVCR